MPYLKLYYYTEIVCYDLIEVVDDIWVCLMIIWWDFVLNKKNDCITLLTKMCSLTPRKRSWKNLSTQT